MPTLSGTLRFWNEDEPATTVVLNRVEFTFHETWEPSLVVEERYVAQVEGKRVTYAEVRGYASGLAIKVDGARHAELIDWVTHGVQTGDGAETRESMPSFVDSIFWDTARRPPSS